MEKRLARLERLAWFMDQAIPLPGGFRIGIDGLIGLIPGIGDTVGGLISLTIVVEAKRLGAPTGLLLRMLWKIFVEWIIGCIPLVGDLFDFGFKSNSKNVALLRKHLEDRGWI